MLVRCFIRNVILCNPNTEKVKHRKKKKERKKMLFIMTKYNVRIFGVIPFFKLQNNT